MKSLPIILVLFIVFGIPSCKNDDPDPKISLLFSMSHKVGNTDVSFNEIIYQNSAGHAYSIVTLKYFLSDFILYSSNGKSQSFDQIVYLDGQDPSTRIFQLNTFVEADEYDSISFTFGLSANNNEAGMFIDAPESNMEWPVAMGTGYHYMKLEGKYDSLNSGVVKNFNVHMGPSMNNDFSFKVSLANSSFTTKDKEVKVKLKMDINSWFNSPTVYDYDAYGQMIMGNVNAQAQLRTNGSDVFSVVSIEN